MPDEPQAPVAELIRQVMGTLTTAERKVARALLASYPVAGLGTVAELAERAGSSPPTVLRFVTRTGFASYPELQRALRREVHDRMGSLAAQYPRATDEPDGSAADGSASARLVTDTFRDLPASELHAATALLSNPKRRVLLAGGRFSRVLVEHLYFHLTPLRDDVHILDDSLRAQVAVNSAGRSHVLVVFDYRRYDGTTAALAAALAHRGASIVLFTDPWLSPVAEIADVVLPARVETSTGFDSLIAAMSLTEELVGSVARQLGDGGRQRTAKIEQVRQELGAPPATPWVEPREIP